MKDCSLLQQPDHRIAERWIAIIIDVVIVALVQLCQHWKGAPQEIQTRRFCRVGDRDYRQRERDQSAPRRLLSGQVV